jgi:preprotein translocase subunit SecG
MLQTGLLVLHIVVAFSLIGIILLQHGKGATAGAAFGSGASSTVFGSQGSATFMTRTTSVLALVFFGNCFLLAYLNSQLLAPQSLLEQAPSEVLIEEVIELPEVPAMPSDLPDIPE